MDFFEGDELAGLAVASFEDLGVELEAKSSIWWKWAAYCGIGPFTELDVVSRD